MKSIDSTKYYEHHSKRLEAERLSNQNPTELLPFLQEMKPNSRILDLGCGTGLEIQRILKAGHRVVGLDGAEQMVSLARARNPGIEIKHKNVLFLDLQAGEFDGIWINSLLNHFEPEMVQRVIAVCFKGISVQGTLGLIVREGTGSFEDRTGDLAGPSQYVHLYGEKQICSMIEQTGFRVEKVGRMRTPEDGDRMLILAKRIGG